MAKKTAGTNHRNRRLPVGELQKRLVVISLIRSEDLFRALSDKLTVEEHFNGPYDKPLALTWQALREFYNRHQKLPNENELFAELQAKLRDSEALDESQQEYLAHQVVGAAYDMDLRDIDPQVIKQYAANILSDAVHEQLKNQLEGGDVVADIPDMLRDYLEQATSITGLQTTAAVRPFDIGGVDAWETDSPAMVKVKTGCEFFDIPMGGGMVTKEVYLLGAPYAGGKTLLAVQLVNNNAKRELAIWNAGGRKGKIPLTYLVSWEEEIESLRIRLLSNWANVPKEVIEEADPKALSTGKKPDTLKEYEKEWYAEAMRRGGRVLGERERLNAAYRNINRAVRIIDFSGGRPELNEMAANMSRGAADALLASQTAEGKPGVSFVVIDHANAATDTRILYHSLKPEVKRELLSMFPRGLKQFIAGVFDCPVWLMHQLDTKSQDREAGFVPKVNAWANCKDMSQYVVFSWMLGKMDLSGLCVLAASKARRTAAILPRVLKINGRFCNVVDAGNSYVIHGSEIVSRNDADRLYDPRMTPESTTTESADRDLQRQVEQLRNNDPSIGM